MRDDQVGRAALFLDVCQRFNAGEISEPQARTAVWILGEGMIFGDLLAELFPPPEDPPPPVPRGGERDG